MHAHIEKSWRVELENEFALPYFKKLESFVDQAYESGPVYPPAENIFRAFELCPFSKVRVVILGQDPYHGPDQAHGLSFSVQDEVRIPPSLKNIYKEIAADTGTTPPSSGNLERWATQGVLLLNSTLTVAAGRPGSHQGKGWEEFTDAAIKKLSAEREHLVFLLWGNFAKKKGAQIDRTKHLVLEAAHPSPLGAYKGFFGCKHFSRTNAYLQEYRKKPIEW